MDYHDITSQSKHFHEDSAFFSHHIAQNSLRIGLVPVAGTWGLLGIVSIVSALVGWSQQRDTVFTDWEEDDMKWYEET